MMWESVRRAQWLREKRKKEEKKHKAMAARPPSRDSCSHRGKSSDVELRIFYLIMYFCISTSFPCLRIYVTQRGGLCVQWGKK